MESMMVAASVSRPEFSPPCRRTPLPQREALYDEFDRSSPGAEGASLKLAPARIDAS